MTLSRLLDTALAGPNGEVWLAIELDKSCQDVAVLIVDMASFSKLMLNRGIAGALMAVRRLQLVVSEVVRFHGGSVVKCVADDVFCTFPDVVSAKLAGDEIVSRVRCSVGIGYGRVLLIDGDLWGSEVNAASRLGEDVATAAEVLLTDAALSRVFQGASK